MTWPFENNTSTIIKYYAKKSIQAGRIKSILSILTIMLATALLSGFILSVVGMETKTKRDFKTSYHALYLNVNEKQLQSLKQDPRLSDTRLFLQAPKTTLANYMVTPIYIEQKDSVISIAKLVEGHYPEEMYEVAVEKAYLKALKLPVELGQQITIPFYDGNTETFTVVGLTDDTIGERSYSLYCSKKYAKQGSQFQNAVTILAARLSNTKQMSTNTFIHIVRKIGADYEISSKSSRYYDRFAASLQSNTDDISIMTLFSIAIIFVSFLVIYSIFYIYIQNQIREFGQLRTMGATSKQIRIILHREGTILTVCGTLLGLPIGCMVAFLFKPGGWSWRNTIIVSLFLFVLIYGMVWLAMRKPAKIASLISPVEATKSTGYQCPYQVSKKLHRRITPFFLAVMGSLRNRKKWIITVLSLSVAGITMMGGTTLLSSLDRERFARHGLLDYGEFEVYLSPNAKQNDNHGQTGTQVNNPLNEEFIQAIRQIDGVSLVTEYPVLEIQFEYQKVTERSSITPFSSKQQSLLESYLKEGKVDYQEMLNQKEILIFRNNYANAMYNWKFQVGDTVKFFWYDGKQYQEDTYKIAGEINDAIFKDSEGGKIFGKTDLFLLPDKLLEEMMVPGFNLNAHLLIELDDLTKEPAVRKSMEDLLEDTSMVSMLTLYDLYQDSKVMYGRTSAVIWGISGFLMLFAIINLINTLIATILSRWHEFSILRAVGMRKRQLQRSIQYEGILLSLWSLCITFVAGTAVGYGIIRYFNDLGDDTWVWNFPLPYFIGYMVISILLPIIISAVIIHLLQKKSIVEQLRELE